MSSIGLQLYTVKEEAAADLFGVLRAVREIGYDGVEFAQVPGEPPEAVASLLQELGLVASGIVVPLQQLQHKASFERAIAYSFEIGSTMILFPWLDEPFRKDAEAYRATAAMLNGFGQTCMDNGLRFLYHVHGYEFVRFGDRTGLEILMQRCDDELVGLELDTYWVQYAGVDPLALYRKYAHRCPAIHFKDMAAGPERRDTEVGNGTVDVRGLVSAACSMPTDWLIVEQEKFRMPPMQSAGISYRNLRRIVNREIGRQDDGDRPTGAT